MSASPDEERIKQIEKELAENRELLKTLDESLEKLRESGDEDMIADIGPHTGARKQRTEEEIRRLEEELRSLRGT